MLSTLKFGRKAYLINCKATGLLSKEPFLRVVKGSLIWMARAKEQVSCTKCLNTVCGDQTLPHCHDEGCMSHYYENTPRGPVLPVFHTSSFNVTPLSRPLSGAVSPENGAVSLSWADVLEKLPVLSNQFYTKLLRSKPLVMAVRSIARLINTTLSPDMLHSLGFEPDWARNHVKSLSGAASCTDHKKILPAEICILMQKLSFLTLVKTSTHIYLLSKDKKHDPASFDMGGLHFALTRYSLDGMSQVFGTNLLPLISPSDGDLLYRAFIHSHVVGNPGDIMGIGSAVEKVTITW